MDLVVELWNCFKDPWYDVGRHERNEWEEVVPEGHESPSQELIVAVEDLVEPVPVVPEVYVDVRGDANKFTLFGLLCLRESLSFVVGFIWDLASQLLLEPLPVSCVTALLSIGFFSLPLFWVHNIAEDLCIFFALLFGESVLRPAVSGIPGGGRLNNKELVVFSLSDDICEIRLCS